MYFVIVGVGKTLFTFNCWESLMSKQKLQKDNKKKHSNQLHYTNSLKFVSTTPQKIALKMSEKKRIVFFFSLNSLSH